jgi:TldD protein
MGDLGPGTFGYDDEGVAADCVTLVDRGIFTNFQSSRDNAPVIGQNSRGMGIADGWNNLPIVRMTNINLQPGGYTFEKMLDGVEYGFLLEENKSWSIDDKRINFQFACEVAREIKNGKLTGKIFKNPIYTGKTTEFWGSCDAVCNESYRQMVGVPNCGKGQPMQIMRCGHASQPARFRKVRFISNG